MLFSPVVRLARGAMLMLVLAPLGCQSLSPGLQGLTFFGLLYSDTTIPLDVNASGQELMADSGTRHTNHWTYAVTIEWDGRGIGQIAREQGFTSVGFADLEVFRVLLFWTERRVHIYGTRQQEPQRLDENRPPEP